MLLELSIKNLAIIDAATISFAPGLNVLTGETGAGKSIVVDAVNLVLGERADKTAIQSGCDKARVEALFDVRGNGAVLAMLAELGIEVEEGMLPVSRELTTAGRTVCRVADTMVQLSTLKQIADLLLDMHGQHEHQSLLDTKRHLALLDTYGDPMHIQRIEAVRADYHAWHDSAKQLAKLRAALSERDARIDLLKYQLAELDAAHLKPNEEEELERQRVFYRNAEKIGEGMTRAYELLYAGEGSQSSALDAMKKGVDALLPLAKLDEAYSQLHERLDEIYYQFEDATGELRALRDGMEYDPDVAEQVEQRLDIISRFKRKYGATTIEMLAARERIATELANLTDAEESEERLEKRTKQLEEKLYEDSVELSLSRHVLAKQFQEHMQQQLGDLGMPHARMRADFAPQPARDQLASVYATTGIDRVEFVLSANLGEEERPLARIASGGELSRIMLALKSISAEKTGIPSMVFDEIDTGISGRMAQVVAEKMAVLAKLHQVICVTHLPQIAAMADAQYLVEKRVENDRTRTHVRELDEAGRAEELARIVGGADSASDSSLAHAKALLSEAVARKQQIRAANQ